MRRPPRPVDGGWLDLTVGRRRSSISEVRLAVGAEHCQARNWRGRAYLGISQYPGFLAQDSRCHPAAGSAITKASGRAECTVCLDSGQNRAGKVGTVDVGTPQVGVHQVHTAEVRSAKVGTLKVCVPQRCPMPPDRAFEVAASQVSPCMSAPNQTPTYADQPTVQTSSSTHAGRLAREVDSLTAGGTTTALRDTLHA